MANFTTVPSLVNPDVPMFHTVITQSESMKKQYQSLSSTATQKFKLLFRSINITVFNTIQAHYAANLGQYANFSWTSVPTYIDTDMSGTGDGNNMTGRWVEGSLKMFPVGKSICNVEIVFEKDV